MTAQAEAAAFYEIAQAKARYCRTLDNQDWAAVADLLTENVEFSITDKDTEAEVVTGRNETLATLRMLVGDAKTVHQVHMPELELRGEEAQVIWAVQDRAVFESGLSVTGYGHYYERWVRRKGGWKISAMHLIHLLVDVHQVGE
ncbi:hypothetical protein AWC29_11615 [Mycobacterium triplex]|uniref:SnoaL-like polyketide cyclase n=1 Tax=Mycobacterium triplex TaxID=47839 RepID=A0A024JZM0_9MYCO|nr:nuclear transport factor 2 family protein [Mycobacterium triplex]ORX05103.1 hypothetical protein AWC29_11615 [Mycobacterium triplex]CDO89116.1 SnoaL-like polyketide cyclase [Mycobacterium triplex]